MNAKLAALMARQQVLQSEALAQREALSVHIHDWHRRLSWLDRGFAVLRFVQRHPTALLSLGAALAYLIPHRSGKALLGLYATIKGLRKFLRLWASHTDQD